MNRYGAEFLGTFWLVLGGCGSAVAGGRVSRRRDRPARCLFRVRPDRADDGLHRRAHLGRPLQPRGVDRSRRRRQLRRRGPPPYIVAQVLGADRGGRRALRHRERQTGVRSRGGFASNGYADHSPGGYSLARRVRGGGRDDGHVPGHHHGRDLTQGACRLRPDCHRPRPDADPPRQHPRHQHLGEPGAQHRHRGVRGRTGRSSSSGCSGSRPSWERSSAPRRTGSSASRTRKRDGSRHAFRPLSRHRPASCSRSS